jgi:hypothetical protein
MGNAVGSAIGGIAGSKMAPNVGSAMGAAELGHNQAWQDAERANAMERDNASWAMGQNQASMDKALAQNRPNQISDFGSSTWQQGPDGQWTQNLSLDSRTQDLLGALRNKYEQIGGQMGGGFDVNGDVMNALRAQMAPGLEQQRDSENARLAAMGLSTGSGTAWGNSQDALNRMFNDAEQKAILGGFNADQQLRQSNRQDLSTLAGIESGWRGNLNMPGFANAGGAQMSQIGVNAPNNMYAQAGMIDQNRAQQTGNMYTSAGGALGGALGSAASGVLGKLGSSVGNWFGGGTQAPAPVEERSWF